MCSQGDIALVPLPFTDQSATRRRPVIVISNDLYNTTSQDALVVAMTSNLQLNPYSFILTTIDLVAGNLNHPGRIGSIWRT